MDNLVNSKNRFNPSVVTLLRRSLQNNLFAITKEKTTNTAKKVSSLILNIMNIKQKLLKMRRITYKG